MKTCKIKGCEKILFARGWCKMHYNRWYFTGNPGCVELKRQNGISKYGFKYKNKSEYAREYRKVKKLKSIDSMHRKRFGGLREKVLKRDNYTCQICGMTDEEHLKEWNCHITIDHIEGGGRYSDYEDHRLDNLWVLCLRCHGRKDRAKGRPYDLLPISSKRKILANLKFMGKVGDKNGQ